MFVETRTGVLSCRGVQPCSGLKLESEDATVLDATNGCRPPLQQICKTQTRQELGQSRLAIHPVQEMIDSRQHSYPSFWRLSGKAHSHAHSLSGSLPIFRHSYILVRGPRLTRDSSSLYVGEAVKYARAFSIPLLGETGLFGTVALTVGLVCGARALVALWARVPHP